MKLVPIIDGAKFKICAIDISDDPNNKVCPTEDFMKQMSESSKKSLAAILIRHKDHGPILNQEKSRFLYQDIYEFKTRQGDRIYYFFDSDRLTILTHGSSKPKGKQLSAEVSRAVDLKDRYLKSKEANYGSKY
jgi:hypothetical protein